MDSEHIFYYFQHNIDKKKMRRFKMKKDFLKQYPSVYFIGIGGISMSGLAEILLAKGFQVAGSDMKESAETEHLRNLGITIHIGHKAENITDNVKLVVYTAAVKEDNPEFVAAKQKNIPIIDRAQLLGMIMEDYPYSVAIAGTHGKTTTTGMVSDILLYAKVNPTITVGGILPTIHSNTKIGGNSYFVAEACEYFDSFLQFHPLIGVILNIEADHLDYFKNLENIRISFHKFTQNIAANGTLIVNHAIPHLEEITANLACRVETFGLEGKADWTAKQITHEADGKNSFDVFYHDNLLGRVHLHIPGDHNITNALAAFAVAYTLSVSTEDIIKGLEKFHGTQRRFERKGEKNGILVIDDYAHHPTEIKATLAAAKKIHHNTTYCVFQPHTYSRTKTLFDSFAESFSDADVIIIADIYAAREKDTGLVTAQQLVEKIKEFHKNAIYCGNFGQITEYLKTHCQAGDLILTIGAGDVYHIGEAFLNA